MKLLLLLLFPALAFGQIPITSPRNNINSDLTVAIGLTPLDGAGKPVSALFQGIPASSSLPSTLTIAFPASATAYTMTAVRASITPAGTGFSVSKDANGNPVPLLLDFPVSPALNVPPGLPVLITMDFPLSGLGDFSATLGSDTASPTASVLSVVPAQTSAAVSWTPSSDNVGVAGYIVERAFGTAGAFAQIALTTATSFPDSGLTMATTYSYRVKATDAAGNSSPYSNVVTVATTTTAASPPPTGFSPDGATAAPGTAPPATSQTIVSAEGTWSFGSQKVSGGYALLLNGQPAGITNFGMLYEYKSGRVWNKNAGGQWYVWNGGDFVPSGAPK